MNVLVLNTGSSSLKFQVLETDLEAIEKNADRQLARGVIERIGSEALVNLKVEGRPALRRTAALRDHRAALDYLLRWLVSAEAGVPGIKALGDNPARPPKSVKDFRRILAGTAPRAQFQEWPQEMQESFATAFHNIILHPKFLHQVRRLTRTFRNGNLIGEEQMYRLLLMLAGPVAMYGIISSQK
jgi:hypothetical protein